MPVAFNYEKNNALEELGIGDDAIFESLTRAFVFAASVGYARNRWVDNHETNGEIRWNYIAQHQRLSMISAALTYAETEEPESIQNPEAQINVLTSYSAGGARILQQEVVEPTGDNLDNLVTFLQQHRDESDLKEKVGVLQQIDKEVSNLHSTD